MRNNSPRTRARPDPTLRNVRSALSNGSRLLLGDVDERGPWCRRLRDLIADQTSDLGGADALADQLETHYGEETLQRFEVVLFIVDDKDGVQGSLHKMSCRVICP